MHDLAQASFEQISIGYALRHQIQFRNMIITAIGGALQSRSPGFGLGLVVGALTGYQGYAT